MESKCRIAAAKLNQNNLRPAESPFRTEHPSFFPAFLIAPQNTRFDRPPTLSSHLLAPSTAHQAPPRNQTPPFSAANGLSDFNSESSQSMSENSIFVQPSPQNPPRPPFTKGGSHKSLTLWAGTPFMSRPTPFTKGGSHKSPFDKGGFRGIFRQPRRNSFCNFHSSTLIGARILLLCLTSPLTRYSA